MHILHKSITKHITRHEKDGTHEYIYKFIFCFFINSILAVIYVYKKVSETD